VSLLSRNFCFVFRSTTMRGTTVFLFIFVLFISSAVCFNCSSCDTSCSNSCDDLCGNFMKVSYYECNSEDVICDCFTFNDLDMWREYVYYHMIVVIGAGIGFLVLLGLLCLCCCCCCFRRRRAHRHRALVTVSETPHGSMRYEHQSSLHLASIHTENGYPSSDSMTYTLPPPIDSTVLPSAPPEYGAKTPNGSWSNYYDDKSPLLRK